MKVYIKSANTFSIDNAEIIESIKKQIVDTIHAFRSCTETPEDYFIYDIDSMESATFPLFYQHDSSAIYLIDKRQEQSNWCIKNPRYILLFAWELDDINLVSDDVMYNLYHLSGYYDEIENVVIPEDFEFFGKYDFINNTFIMDSNEQHKNQDI